MHINQIYKEDLRDSSHLKEDNKYIHALLPVMIYKN